MSPEAKQLLRELIILRRRENRELQMNADSEIVQAFKDNFATEERALEEIWKENQLG